MELIYFLVPFSLIFSLGFLAAFFWAVDTDQFQSLFSVPYSILDDDSNQKGEVHNERE